MLSLIFCSAFKLSPIGCGKEMQENSEIVGKTKSLVFLFLWSKLSIFFFAYGLNSLGHSFFNRISVVNLETSSEAILVYF